MRTSPIAPFAVSAAELPAFAQGEVRSGMNAPSTYTVKHIQKGLTLLPMLTVIAGNIGPQAVVPEEVVTVPASFVIGSGIGGIAGGVIGSISGVTVAEKVYDWAFTPGECDQYVICGEE